MDAISNISLSHLALSLAPIAIVMFIQHRWNNNTKETLWAVTRMLTQLAVIGYLLVFIFTSKSPFIILAVIFIMLSASAWIALRTVKPMRLQLYPTAFLSIFIGGTSVLVLITQGVLQIDPWFKPQYLIPLAGMVYAYSMNALSLGADRYYHETGQGADPVTARSSAFRAALIPVTNSFFAVGLVLIPGMMTGQILSGVDPLIAARYQIMVMAMVFGAGGLSSAIFLALVSRSE
ncbi:MAG: ABC transporter permease [Acidimicrobiales bacterium]|nr:ABC transporter permease [Hyphomonadaceae bacterium]RZV41404.1 MAG: ABC transporter permease [Acidimicrobiales bacterium]